MYYVSTRDAGRRLTASQAIVEGLSRDGGLYLPEEIPQLTMDEIKALAALSYPERAAKIMKRYLDEFTEEELLGFAKSAYGPAKFDTPAAAPVVRLTENTYIQELWHGPTCAFKDMALQMLPYLLTASLRKTGEEKTVCILVATSGDTGKAALEGFRDVDRTKILVFYPDGGVSEMQKLQMVTQEGKNVGVCAVRGNFDDAQTGVKRIFSDAQLRETLAEVKTREGDAQKNYRVRVAVVGSEIDDPDLIKLIESCGALVVADRYCYGSFPGRQEIVLTDGEDALTQVCRWYLQHTECPRQSALHRVQYRNDHVAQLVHDFKADGAIYEQMKFCTYWSYERVIANQVMPRDYGIHILSIDRPYIAGQSGQLRTRVQAFVESLEMKQLRAAQKEDN